MASQLDLQALKPLTPTGVAHHCEQETEGFFQRQGHDPRYCLELFRVAILERELCVHYQIFPDVTKIYRVKQNVPARLRGDAKPEKILSPDA